MLVRININTIKKILHYIIRYFSKQYSKINIHRVLLEMIDHKKLGFLDAGY